MLFRIIITLPFYFLLCGCSHVTQKTFEQHIQQNENEISSINNNIQKIATENKDLNALLEEYKDLIVQQDLQNKKLQDINIIVQDLLGKYNSLNSKVDSTNYRTLLELSSILQTYLNQKDPDSEIENNIELQQTE